MNYACPIWFWLMQNWPVCIASVPLGIARWPTPSKES